MPCWARISRIWRKSCAGKRSCDSGLGAVNEWQVTDDGRKKPKTKTSFQNNQKSRQAGAGNDVAHAKSKKGRAAEIDIRQETWLAAGHNHRGPSAILHEAEAKHEANGPNPDEHKERERAVESQQSFTGLRLRDEADHEFPQVPSGAVKKASEAELSRDTARQDNGLKGDRKSV